MPYYTKMQEKARFPLHFDWLCLIVIEKIDLNENLVNGLAIGIGQLHAQDLGVGGRFIHDGAARHMHAGLDIRAKGQQRWLRALIGIVAMGGAAKLVIAVGGRAHEGAPPVIIKGRIIVGLDDEGELLQ